MTQDEQMIRDVLDGKVESFRAIIERYQRPVLRMVSNIINDHHAAEDVTQEVFMAVFNKLSTFEYKISVPNHIFGPRKVKVALAWTSKATKTSILFLSWYMSQLTVDLDLIIYDENGAQVGYSGSWDNSYEVAEFTGQPGKTYTIKIRRWSGTDATWYGIAWSVTGGLTITLNPELMGVNRFLG